MTKPKPKHLLMKRGRRPKGAGPRPEFPPEIPGNSGRRSVTANGKPIGRPYSLVADKATLEKVKLLGQIHATEIEAAAFLGVVYDTLIAFFEREPEAKEIFYRAQAEGKIGLRRAQYKKALEGNPEMQKWLGRQLLGQQEKTTVENTGSGGGPIAVVAEIDDAVFERFAAKFKAMLG